MGVLSWLLLGLLTILLWIGVFCHTFLRFGSLLKWLPELKEIIYLLNYQLIYYQEQPGGTNVEGTSWRSERASMSSLYATLLHLVFINPEIPPTLLLKDFHGTSLYRHECLNCYLWGYILMQELVTTDSFEILKVQTLSVVDSC